MFAKKENTTIYSITPSIHAMYSTTGLDAGRRPSSFIHPARGSSRWGSAGPSCSTSGSSCSCSSGSSRCTSRQSTERSRGSSLSVSPKNASPPLVVYAAQKLVTCCMNYTLLPAALQDEKTIAMAMKRAASSSTPVAFLACAMVTKCAWYGEEALYSSACIGSIYLEVFC